MSLGKLSALQVEVLAALARVPGWVLTGGAALAGWHLAHRETRDLDLFFRGLREHEPLTIAALERALGESGVRTTPEVRSVAFVRYLLTKGAEQVVLDLVAEPVPAIEEAESHPIGDTLVHIDSAREILCNKLNALVSRSELRDLVDVKALLATGLSFEDALTHAAQKDSGFSPIVLQHVLATFPIALHMRRSGASTAEVTELERFAHDLARQAARSAFVDTRRPPDSP